MFYWYFNRHSIKSSMKLIIMASVIFGISYTLVTSSVLIIYAFSRNFIIITTMDEMVDTMGVAAFLVFLGSVYSLYKLIKKGKVEL